MDTVPSLIAQTISVDSVLSDKTVPKFYTNGFVLGHSLVDITIILQLSQAPVAAINMSFTSMKTLHKNLEEIIAAVEKGLGHNLLDLTETNIKWQKNLNPTPSTGNDQ